MTRYRACRAVVSQLVDQGKFSFGSRLRFTIEDTELQKFGFELIKQLVDHSPGTSLARILKTYHLTFKMNGNITTQTG